MESILGNKKILKDKKLIALVLILALFTFIFISAIPFINAFFGALIIFIIFQPMNKWLREKVKLPKSLSAWIIIILSLIIVVIPLFFLVNGLAKQISSLPAQLENLEKLKALLREDLPFGLGLSEDRIIQEGASLVERSLTSIFSNAAKAFAILFLMFFLLYYMLLDSGKFMLKAQKALPFKRDNARKIMEKFKDITYATVIGTILIAIVQGGLLALGFYFFGIPSYLFWGFVGAILSIIPVIGIPVIWIPAGIFLAVQGSIGSAIGMLIWGAIISTSDNIIRPVVNDKFGRIHPLASIIGIYIGLSQFGFVGLFIGPLFVAYLLLLWKMYKEEYLD